MAIIDERADQRSERRSSGRRDRGTDPRSWARAGLLAGAMVTLVASGCAPRIDQGGCDEDSPCSGRGQTCDLEVNECVAAEVDVGTTESPAPGSFSDKVIAFHRGEICLPHEVQSGESLPVVLRQCVHPCVAASSYEFEHSFECRGSSCSARVLMYTVGSSAPTGCPAEAFSSFDAAQCQYVSEVEFQLSTSTSNGPISGSMLLEVPFLTNADAAEIAADPDDDDLVDMLVQQYPQLDARIPDGRAISILPGNPPPPPSCRDGACPCHPIGF